SRLFLRSRLRWIYSFVNMKGSAAGRRDCRKKGDWKMRDSKKCVKCGSEYVMRMPGCGESNYLQLGLSKMSQYPIDRYICLDCGYVEDWMHPGTLQRMKEKLRDRGDIE
ncbi:MAG: hypothetical protein IJE87_01160, partial [Firmicutes bacterium]|nr:hypothetical protein [Bacillota bacterium]